MHGHNRAFIRHPSDIPIELLAERRIPAANGELHDVSLGGLSCRSEKRLNVGALVRVKIPFVRPPFETEGRVVWCRRSNSEYEVGIQFIEVQAAFKARMVEQICHIEHYKNEIREREGRELSGHQAAMEWISKYASQFPDPAMNEPEEPERHG
jgi:hypothetical protein